MTGDPEIAAIPATKKADRLWELQETLTYRVKLSALYHAKRERFLDILERCCQAGTAISATAAFAKIFTDDGWGKYLGLLAAVLSVLPLVFGFAQRAREHGQLANTYGRLLAEMKEAGLVLAELQLIKFDARVAELEATEKASLGALVVQCQNEIAIEMNQSNKVVELGVWRKLWMHVYDFDVTDLVAPNNPKN